MEVMLLGSKRKPALNETDDRKLFVNKVLTNFLITHIIKKNSSCTSKKATFAEIFVRKKPSKESRMLRTMRLYCSEI